MAVTSIQPGEAELETAILAVSAGLEVARARATSALHVTAKDGVDVVTDADLAAEDAIRAVLEQRCPEIAIVGEERGGEASAGAAHWLIDPICGTRNYASQLPLYSTNLALVVAGKVRVAAVGDGTNGRVYAALSGKPAFLASDPARPLLRVAHGSVVALDLAGKPPFQGDLDAIGRLFAKLVGDGRFHPRYLSSTLPFAKLASGDIAAALLLSNGDADPLHSAAGCALAEAAGAIITDERGEPWRLGGSSLIGAATPELHRRLLALVRESFVPRA
jgi:myo-inositol-1(or 4)-monophosphatase